MTKPTVKPTTTKQKQSRLTNNTSEWAKKNRVALDFYHVIEQNLVISTFHILNHIIYDYTRLHVTSSLATDFYVLCLAQFPCLF